MCLPVYIRVATLALVQSQSIGCPNTIEVILGKLVQHLTTASIRVEYKI